MKKIADSGLIIAGLDKRDPFHRWARELLETQPPPWLVCEPVLAEVSASVGTPLPVLEMLVAGDLELAFDMSSQKAALQVLARKYQDYGMDLADACVVRMSELFSGSVIYTVDRKDFSVYRQHGNRALQCVFS